MNHFRHRKCHRMSASFFFLSTFLLLPLLSSTALGFVRKNILKFATIPVALIGSPPGVNLLHGTFQDLHVHGSNHKKGLVDEYNTMKCLFEKVFKIDWYESNVNS